VFNEEESCVRCLDDYRGSRRGWFYKKFQPKEIQFKHPRLKDKKGNAVYYALEVQRAPEPSNIIWENIEVTDSERFLRRCAVNFVTFILLLVSFALIWKAQIAKRDAEAAQPNFSACEVEIPAVYYGTYRLPADLKVLFCLLVYISRAPTIKSHSRNTCNLRSHTKTNNYRSFATKRWRRSIVWMATTTVLNWPRPHTFLPLPPSLATTHQALTPIRLPFQTFKSHHGTRV
jgi:hypothetical protein